MASIADMGEVDEIHSNEDSIRDGASVNGDLNEFNKDENESTNISEDELEPDDNTSDNDDNLQIQEIDSVDGQFVEDEEDDDKMDVEEIVSDEQIHEINNSDDEDDLEISKDDVNGVDDADSDKVDDSNSIIINDVGEADCEDVVILDDGDPIENGDNDVEAMDTNSKASSDAEVISLDEIPTKKDDSIQPRRSNRNLNKEKKTYSSLCKSKSTMDSSEESDIEEILPEDPLAVIDPAPQPKNPRKKARMSGSTIVVKDTKCLAEIASKSASSNNNKKEPTLVIIDTNSILSGRGPVPISQKSSTPSTTIPSSFSMLPVALPAQGIYPANMRATITPIPLTPAAPVPKLTSTSSQPPVLPTLTDDMFVVEAPSFIVPYVYEKPPLKELKEFIKVLAEEIKEEQRKLDEQEENDGEKTKQEETEAADEKSESENKKDCDVVVISDKEGNGKEEKDIELELPAMAVPNPMALASELRKPATYFDSPLGKFFMGIGYSLVQESVQTDLLKQQKRKRDRENGQNVETTRTINSLIRNLEFTKENNEPYRMPIKKCEFCSFKTESLLTMAFHLETPHMKNYVYRCNFCTHEVRSPHDILYHMELKHGVRGRLERAPAFHQCPNCPFEDNQKGKLTRHSVACLRKFKPERNLEPLTDFEPPAKIPRAPRMKQQGIGNAAAAYQAMVRSSQYQMISKLSNNAASALQRGRGRPSMGIPMKNPMHNIKPANSGMMYKPGGNMSGGSVLVPTNYQLSGNQLYQVVGGPEMGGTAYLPNLSTTPNSLAVQHQAPAKTKSSQPSISITPLPRGTPTPAASNTAKPGDSNSKNSFVICEICDGYIKDLEQLRNHMQWIHKVKIHPKMIYNRPPLNCQKCQFRFFTDQGLERHLLGSHGLVTSSMQEAANRSKDSGRCPVCGRVYQWKLLNHVARDHNVTLKPAHLSYKCTVCTATFGMYKQFESHVYSAHSVVAKRVMDKKTSSSTSSKSESVLKPLKINDEITIIPQPAKSTANGDSNDDSVPSTSGLSAGRASNGSGKIDF